jgi:hypothetical protein
MPDAGHPPICPECGTPAGALPPHKPLWLRCRRPLQLTVFLVALGWIGWKNSQHWTPLPAPAVLNTAIESVDLPLARFTRDDLSRIAGGTFSGPSLAESLWRDRGLRHLPPATSLTSTFVPPANAIVERHRYGWPLPWLVYRYRASYDDVYRAADMTAAGAPAPTRVGWSDGTHFTQRIDERGRREFRWFEPRALAGLAILLIAAWWAGVLMSSLIRHRRIGEVSNRRSLIRIARITPLLLVALLAGILSLHPEQRKDPTLNVIPPTTTDTGLTAGALQMLIDELGPAAADAALATAILARTSESIADDQILAIGLFNGYARTLTYTARGWPRRLISMSRVTYGGDPPSRRNPRAEWDGRSFTLHRISLSNGNSTIHTTRIDANAAAPVLLILCLLVSAGGVPCHMAAHLQRRRQRARLSGGLCLHCGYDIGRPTPEYTISDISRNSAAH